MDVKHLIGYMIVASISFAWFSGIFWFMYYVAARGVDNNKRHYNQLRQNSQYGKSAYPSMQDWAGRSK